MKTGLQGASGGLWLPSSMGFGFVGTFTLTRNAAGNYSHALTAAANSPFFVFPLREGIFLRSIDVVFSLATANLTTFTAGLYQRKFTTGAVAGMTTMQAPTSLGVTTSTNIKVVNLPVTTPYFVGNHENVGLVDNSPDTDDWLELAIVNPGTSVLNLYGVMLYGERQI